MTPLEAIGYAFAALIVSPVALAFGVRCPRTFRAYATKWEPLDGYDEESPF